MTIILQIAIVIVVGVAAFVLARSRGARHQAIRRLLLMVFVVAAATTKTMRSRRLIAWWRAPRERARTKAATPTTITTAICRMMVISPVSYTHLRAHETKANLVCR